MRATSRRLLAASAASLAALALLASAAGDGGQPLAPAPCSTAFLVEDLRGALADGSPALQRYARLRLVEAGLRLPIDELRAAFAAERDPAVLEALGSALATRSSNAGDPAIAAAVIDRARSDGDPALRAAALRGLRGTGSVEIMEKARRASYTDFMRDPAPEVRAAAADNLLHEDASVYFGHEGPVSDAAIAAASASPDPAVAARLLAGISTEQASAGSVRTLIADLSHDDPALRASAARALGGVPAAHAEEARRALLELYARDSTRAVRVAVLEALVQLGLGAARPTLQSLRGIDPGLAPEIDAWLTVLATNLQEWSIILREKKRLKP